MEKIRLREGAQNTYILTSDSTGVGTWMDPTTLTREQICVTDFGAVGDGTTDDTQAFQDAIDSVGILGGTVCIPFGDYKITSTLQMPGGIILQGAGLGNSIDGTGTAKGSRISFTGSGVYAIEVDGDFAGCRDLALVDAGGNASGGILVKASGSLRVAPLYSNVLILNFTNGTGLTLQADNSGGMAFGSFYEVHIRNAKKGIHISVETGSFYQHSFIPWGKYHR